MKEIKRQSPKALRDREVRRELAPARRGRRDLLHDDRGIANDRRTEDEQLDEPAENDGWNSNT